jgi:predicted RNA binding protein YcfA (HicA-like mRNA interferase family)
MGRKKIDGKRKCLPPLKGGGKYSSLKPCRKSMIQFINYTTKAKPVRLCGNTKKDTPRWKDFWEPLKKYWKKLVINMNVRYGKALSGLVLKDINLLLELNNVAPYPGPLEDASKIFLSHGFKFARQSGSHRSYVKEGILRPVVIPTYTEVPISIIRNNLKTAGISRDEYLKFISGEYQFILAFAWIPWIFVALFLIYKTQRRIYIALAALFLALSCMIKQLAIIFVWRHCRHSMSGGDGVC